MVNKKGITPHYAWIILISCILLKIGLGGVVMSIAGNFVTPVVNELGTKVSEFTMLISIEAAAMAMFYPTAAKMLSKKKIGKVMGFAALLQVVGVALMSLYNSIYLFYVSGVMIGIGVAFTGFVAIPIVIGMWFPSNTGTALGIVIAAENIAIVFYNLFSASLIVKFGWRFAYLILALLALVISVPPIFLFLKSPEEKGVEPYKVNQVKNNKLEKTNENLGLMKKEAIKMPLFYLTWFTCMLYSISCGVQQYLANFTTMEMEQSILFGSKVAMTMSLGSVLSSVILGYINDKLGVKAGLLWGTFFFSAGYGTLIHVIRTNNLGFIIPASMLVGLGGSMYTVQSPLVVRRVFGEKDFSSIWALMMVGNSLVGALSFSPIGLFYDIGGTYKGAFIMAIALQFFAFLLGSLALEISKKAHTQYKNYSK